MIYLKINFLRNINLNNIRHKKFNKKFFNNKFNLEYHSFFEKDIKNSSQIVIIFVIIDTAVTMIIYSKVIYFIQKYWIGMDVYFYFIFIIYIKYTFIMF